MQPNFRITYLKCKWFLNISVLTHPYFVNQFTSFRHSYAEKYVKNIAITGNIIIKFTLEIMIWM